MDERDFHAGSAGKFSEWAAALFFLIGLAFLSNALGPLTRQTNTAAAVAFITLFAIVTFLAVYHHAPPF